MNRSRQPVCEAWSVWPVAFMRRLTPRITCRRRRAKPAVAGHVHRMFGSDRCVTQLVRPRTRIIKIDAGCGNHIHEFQTLTFISQLFVVMIELVPYKSLGSIGLKAVQILVDKLAEDDLGSHLVLCMTLSSARRRRNVTRSYLPVSQSNQTSGLDKRIWPRILYREQPPAESRIIHGLCTTTMTRLLTESRMSSISGPG